MKNTRLGGDILQLPEHCLLFSSNMLQDWAKPRNLSSKKKKKRRKRKDLSFVWNSLPFTLSITWAEWVSSNCEKSKWIACSVSSSYSKTKVFFWSCGWHQCYYSSIIFMSALNKIKVCSQKFKSSFLIPVSLYFYPRHELRQKQNKKTTKAKTYKDNYFYFLF